MHHDPQVALHDMRRRIFGGSHLLLDSLSKAELEAVYALILEGEVEIICEACKPSIVRKLPP